MKTGYFTARGTKADQGNQAQVGGKDADHTLILVSPISRVACCGAYIDRPY